ncbi:3-oxo-5-alpha-steroid 4-dehydrogenase 2 isoform X1 [Larimichthys crocea]|uniref:3-oxo-5-alpha-steroid 4-dehydrogenase 2 isoform X1 n=1 Tax=Larimichthys crocea TaxID=215358 RepID=UPI000F5F0636|nr:3-oxo-5-alpha-steroid 4-dehydrogenase 2 isoform X1 [Larimichthys crocea]
MECRTTVVSYLSWILIGGGMAYLLHQKRNHARYGRYVTVDPRCCSARLGWFLQELPAFLLPLLLLFTEESSGQWTRRMVLLCTFMLHYFHRSIIYAFLTRGRPVPLPIVFYAAIFCSLNGFLQGHHLLHCARPEDLRLTDTHTAAGLVLFVVGMSINIHSDHILRSLRKPGETVYRIPHGTTPEPDPHHTLIHPRTSTCIIVGGGLCFSGGMFEFVSGANFFGEIVEWCGYAVATWSLPTFAFAFFTICSIGPRACHHHRDYQQRFEDYPRSRKALIPFIL